VAISLWRDVAVILLVIELMIMVLPFFFLFYFALKGMLSLNRFMRGFLPRVGGVSEAIQRGTNRAAEAVVAPVIAVYSYRAFGRGLVKGTLSLVKGRSG
jgi:hypothetical protein